MTHWSLICGVTSIGPDTGQLIGIFGILTKQEATEDEDGPDKVDSDVSPRVVDTSSLQRVHHPGLDLFVVKQF